ncbi:MAG: flagellar hook-basal body complex protein FliE [Pseudomonadota bacterium]|nr:flagellar hook-basal body complex protein FliE [Pseudomonadota bacterium]
MAVDALKAAEFYQNIARIGAEAPRVDEAERPNFSGLVTQAIAETGATMKAGEGAAMQVAAGKASLVDVVTAISAAEAALETAIAVRNRVIEAYQEIMRMPI